MTELKPIVMLVEDNSGDAVIVDDALKSIGFFCTIIRMENAVVAYQYLQRRPPYEHGPRPDLIVLDLNLPVISGTDFLRELRGTAIWRDIPVIVFSSSSQEEHIKEAIDLGALRYVPKPPIWSGYLDAAKVIEQEWREHVGAA